MIYVIKMNALYRTDHCNKIVLHSLISIINDRTYTSKYFAYRRRNIVNMIICTEQIRYICICLFNISDSFVY